MLVENRHTDHTNVARVMIFFVGVRFPHRAESEGSHQFPALPETFHNKLCPRREKVTTFENRSFAAIDDIKTTIEIQRIFQLLIYVPARVL